MNGLSREGHELRHTIERLAEPRSSTTAQRATATGGGVGMAGAVAYGLAGDLLLRATRGVWGAAGPVPMLVGRACAGLLED